MARLPIDPASSVPVYEQIVAGIRSAIARGEYRPGDQIPSVRQLALRLLVNPNTVAKAYRELERDGVTRSRKGTGIFVSNGADTDCRRRQARAAAQSIAHAFRDAVAAGLTPQQLTKLVDNELKLALRATRQGGGP